METRKTITRIFLTLMVCCLSQTVWSQATVDVSKAGDYYMDGKKLKKRDLDRLYTSSTTLPDWTIARRNKPAANWFGFFGGFGLGWGVYDLFNPPSKRNYNIVNVRERDKLIRNANTTTVLMLGIGVVSTAVSIPCMIKYKKHSYAAAVNYNKDLKATAYSPAFFSVGGGDSGLSLSYNF